MLLPHLIRANKVQKSLRLLEAQDAVLDTLDLGVAFVSGTGELISCNRTTDDILLAGDGFSIREGRLRANDSVANARLQAVLRSTVSATPAIDCPAVVAVPRSSLKRPYQVTAAHLPNGLPAFAGMQLPQVVLLIVDPELQHPPAREALIHLFGLTPREAALASALSTGRTINEAADDLRMTYETARSHLRRIFGKTNTSRQTELILLLARLPKQRAADSEA
jgi:DNA-binding CsgD family transcriptional regulator